MRKKFSQSGLTFVELLISITILSIAVAAILVSVNFASKVSRHSINKAAAVNLATEKLEQIKKDSYSNITTVNYPAESGLTVGSSPVSFNRTVGIATASYKTITVTVTWNQLGAPFVESESMVTIISQ